MRSRLLSLTALCAEYCSAVEGAPEMEKEEFVKSMLSLLPRIYFDFFDIQPDGADLLEEQYYPQYLDEDYYDSIRRRLESVLGEDDTFLETFEEDMKYSDTPIAASISESLADIFQPLYDFLQNVRESGGDDTVGAFLQARESFESDWSQTLCNVLRALNHLYLNLKP